MDNDKTQARPPEYGGATGSVLRTVEQPTRITDDGYLFFLRGYSNFGAEYGARLTRAEYERDLQNQAGAGKLIEQDGTFMFAQNDRLHGREGSEAE